MPENLSVEELREHLEGFVRYRNEHLRGDEKGEAAIFLENLFRALGHEGVRQAGATLEQRIQRRDNGGTAYADLEWKPRVLVEMKRAGRDLTRDYRQAFEYWIDMVPDRPQFVVLCNFDEFWVYDLNRQLDEPVDRLDLADLPRRWEALAFLLPEEERPQFGNDLVAVTRNTAAMVSRIFNRIVDRGVDRDVAQRFILQAVMAMFSEDIGLLPRHLFGMAVDDAVEGHGSAYDLLFGLFREMNTPGATPTGRFEGTPYFNGGLYADITPFELTTEEVAALGLASSEDWSQVRPVIFGTLFEQSLDQPERHAYGAYFTSEADIQEVVLPTIVRPWRKRIEEADTLEEMGQVENDMLQYQILDPACGSGNFLYVAYRELRLLEHELHQKRLLRSREGGRREALRLSFVSTRQFHGIDMRPFAVEVAKVTMMLARKLAADQLGDERTYLPLDDLNDNFQTANAITAPWPRFDACISNPPYLGGRFILQEKSPEEIAAIRREYPEIGGAADYVSYWFRKTHDLLPDDGYAGLVATQNIRAGETRPHTLDYIVDNGGTITDAVSSKPWSGDAVVEVSIVNWTKAPYDGPRTLWLTRGATKMEVPEITGSLSPNLDMRAARDLAVNQRPQQCFQGQTPQHRGFVITPNAAQQLVDRDPRNLAVIHPYLIGRELSRDGVPSRFIIDIPASEVLTAQTTAPDAFRLVKDTILPDREALVAREAERNRRMHAADPNARLNWERRDFMDRWWQLWRRRDRMLTAVGRLSRYIVLSRVATHDRPSVYAFVSPTIHPGDALTVFAFEDDYSFGILHSTYHRQYFEARCTNMRIDPRYTSRTVWNSFPWPQAPTEETAGTVAQAAKAILDHREAWLTEGISLQTQYDSLREPGRNTLRTLQEQLDQAVATAYGFSPDDDPLAQLLALNLSIARQEDDELAPPRAPGNEGLPDTKLTEHRIEPPVELG